MSWPEKQGHEKTQEAVEMRLISMIILFGMIIPAAFGQDEPEGWRLGFEIGPGVTFGPEIKSFTATEVRASGRPMSEHEIFVNGRTVTADFDALLVTGYKRFLLGTGVGCGYPLHPKQGSGIYTAAPKRKLDCGPVIEPEWEFTKNFGIWGNVSYAPMHWEGRRGNNVIEPLAKEKTTVYGGGVKLYWAYVGLLFPHTRFDYDHGVMDAREGQKVMVTLKLRVTKMWPN